ncbi:MAG TPA: DUF1552 domain-containing protein, partial [Polyangiaceae bacterium LLY-WYZ-14_1]|nr:DUF1552 domain-containing protein [Polyangiaceae bacterium LLY-WYZ-14_1]
PFPFLNVGTFFRDNDVFRYVHSWSDDGQPAQARPLGQPTAVFDRLFGGSGAPAPEGGVSDRLRRSVLDTVLDDYRHLTGDAGGLGVESRARIHEHLERLRELERRLDADPVDPGACAVPDPVATDPRLWEEDQEEAPSKPTIVPENWIRHWDLLTEIYAMGIRCDLFRFGNVTFQGAAERAFLRGPYDYDGRTVLFDDRQDHHEAWHGYNGLAVPQDRMAWHMHFILDQTVRFLEKLDDPAYPTESGGTLLDDSLVVVGTELGDGSRHATRDVFHAVSSAGGRLATGVVDEGAMMQVDFLNTCLQAVGIDRSMGDERRAEGPVDRMLA